MESLITDNLRLGDFYFEQKKYSSQWMYAEIDKLCQYLEAKCESQSPFVYLYATNHVKTVIALFAIIKTGKICVLIDPQIGKIELSEYKSDLCPSAELRFESEEETFNFFPNATPPAFAEKLTDVCLILFACADDGRSRPVLLTNKNLFSNAENVAHFNKVSEQSISCALIPFCHLFAMQTGVITPSLFGGSVFISEMISASNLKTVLGQLISKKITHFYSIPLVYYMLNKWNGERMKDVISYVCGGYKLPESIYRNCLKKDITILEGYGLTETSPISACHRPGDKVNIESVGKPCGDYQIYIDRSGNESDKSGEVIISGKHVMKGYYGNFKDTKIDEYGRFRTGDLGYLDDENYLILTGMKKEMFNVTGKKVYKRELERLLSLHENVKGVVTSKETNTVNGDSIKAKIALRNNNEIEQDNFRTWCKINITAYKVPRQIDFL